MQTTIREEQILNKTATFTPLTKDEMFLSEVVSGGGGSSDLSVATLTLKINNTNDAAEAYVEAPICLESRFGPVAIGGRETYNNAVNEIPVILYKGKAQVSVDAEELISFSGNINVYDELMTGDCEVVVRGYAGGAA